MAESVELTKEEQELFKQMAGEDDAPDPKETDDGKGAAAADAVKKADAEKATKEAAEKAASDAKSKEQKTVPAEALREARSENKELRKELDAMKGVVAEGDKKLQKFIESVSKRASEDTGPKFEDDPAGALKHENELLKNQITEINAKLAKQAEAGDSQNKMQQFASFVTAREQAFSKEQPDYFKAAEYVAEVWRDEFREAGYKDEEIPQLVFGKSLAVTNKAAQSQKDPAATIYNIAKRYGFTAKQQDDPKKEEVKGESKLEQIKRGVEVSKTGGGGNGPDDLSLASLAQMDDEQIEKLVSDKDWWSKNIRRSPLH